MTFLDKARDLVLRAEGSSTSNRHGAVEKFNSDVASSDFTYGSVDTRPMQSNERLVRVRQGNGFANLYFNPSTREARPIHVSVRD